MTAAPTTSLTDLAKYAIAFHASIENDLVERDIFKAVMCEIEWSLHVLDKTWEQLQDAVEELEPSIAWQ